MYLCVGSTIYMYLVCGNTVLLCVQRVQEYKACGIISYRCCPQRIKCTSVSGSFNARVMIQRTQSTLLSWSYCGNHFGRNLGEKIGGSLAFKTARFRNLISAGWGCWVSRRRKKYRVVCSLSALFTFVHGKLEIGRCRLSGCCSRTTVLH